MRSREQIIADCEKRYLELKQEADRRSHDPLLTRKCQNCKFSSVEREDLPQWTCNEPLVTGFDGPKTIASWARSDIGFQVKYDFVENKPNSLANKIYWKFPMPCGPEKALWQRKPSWIERIINFWEK